MHPHVNSSICRPEPDHREGEEGVLFKSCGWGLSKADMLLVRKPLAKTGLCHNCYGKLVITVMENLPISVVNMDADSHIFFTRGHKLLWLLRVN